MSTSDRVAAGLLIGMTQGVVAGSIWLAAAVLVAGTAWVAVRGWRATSLLIGAFGMVWGTAAGIASSSHRLGLCADGALAIIEGDVTGLPDFGAGSSRFDLQLSGPLAVARCGTIEPRRLRLSWYGPTRIATGERWQFEVRLRRHRNFANPGGFDYVAWATERGIDGGGTVLRGMRVAPARRTLDAARDALSQAIDAAGARHAPLFRALSNGDARALDDATWQAFRTTGTVHLLVISGLHVGIAATLGAMLGAVGWRLLARFARRRSDHACAACLGAIGAGGYAALAGFALPVTRAWIMSAAVLLWWSAGRRVSVGRLLAWTLVALLLCDPLAVTDTSLWLSFGAVAVLVGYFTARRGMRWGTVFARAQVVLFLILVPVLVAGVGQFGWLAPIANAVSVPLVSGILVPLMLAAMVCLPLVPVVSGWCYAVADVVAAALMHWTSVLVDLSHESFWPRPPAPDLFLALAVAAMLLLPLGRWIRLLGLLPLMTILLMPAHRPVPWGEGRVTTLDVGQGQAIVVETAKERMLVDAGPRFRSGFDLGAAVVVPALRATAPAWRAPSLDLLVVSHADVDHAGGVPAVTRGLRTRAVLAGEPQSGIARCRRGQSWQWSGVRIRVLGPPSTATGNAASCVIHVQARSGSMLLPGDIGSLEEATLVARQAVAADLLVAPHHGSRTSSSLRFVEAVAPRVVVISAGHRNPFGHPHAEVLARYASTGAAVGITARDGAIIWESIRPDRLGHALELVEHVP